MNIWMKEGKFDITKKNTRIDACSKGLLECMLYDNDTFGSTVEMITSKKYLRLEGYILHPILTFLMKYGLHQDQKLQN